MDAKKPEFDVDEKIRGDTALYLLVRAGHVAGVKALLDARADPNIEDYISLTFPYRSSDEYLFHMGLIRGLLLDAGAIMTVSNIKEFHDTFVDGYDSERRQITGFLEKRPELLNGFICYHDMLVYPVILDIAFRNQLETKVAIECYFEILMENDDRDGFESLLRKGFSVGHFVDSHQFLSVCGSFNRRTQSADEKKIGRIVKARGRSKNKKRNKKKKTHLIREAKRAACARRGFSEIWRDYNMERIAILAAATGLSLDIVEVINRQGI